MNGKAGYEQVITGKLEAIPLPDMADAIWSRIERELDADMPTDEGGDGPASGPSLPKGLILGGLSSLFLISILAYFFLINKPNPQPIPETQKTEQPSLQTNITDNKPRGPDPSPAITVPATSIKDNTVQTGAPR